MAEREDITYEFEDLRRNDDELPPHIAAQLTVDDTGDEGGDADGVDGGAGDGNGAGDEELVPLSEVNKRLTRVRREANRKLEAAREEAGETIGDLQKRVDKIEHGSEEAHLNEAASATPSKRPCPATPVRSPTR